MVRRVSYTESKNRTSLVLLMSESVARLLLGARGALEQASPGDLTEDEIFSLIKEYQPWRIAHELNAGRDEAFVVKYPLL